LSIIEAPLTKEEFVRKGEEIYETIKRMVEDERKGEMVAIDVETGDYFIAPSIIKAVKKVREKYPSKIFYIERIGYRATHAFK
jgi:hypothetical protein